MSEPPDWVINVLSSRLGDDPDDRVCPDCDWEGEPCRQCQDENFEPPEPDDSQEGQGEVEWESPE